MKHHVIRYMFFFSLLGCSSMTFAGSNFETAIITQINNYETALNNADVDKVVSLFNTDAELIAQGGRPAKGIRSIRIAYQNTFSAVHLNIRFQLKEIIRLSPEWALARTESNGEIKVTDNRETIIPENNNEMFLLHQDASGKWLFAKYMYNTVKN